MSGGKSHGQCGKEKGLQDEETQTRDHHVSK